MLGSATSFCRQGEGTPVRALRHCLCCCRVAGQGWIVWLVYVLVQRYSTATLASCLSIGRSTLVLSKRWQLVGTRTLSTCFYGYFLGRTSAPLLGRFIHSYNTSAVICTAAITAVVVALGLSQKRLAAVHVHPAAEQLHRKTPRCRFSDA